ncbi:DUF4153 domain-containing protein [Sphingomonas sp. PB2P19]|uniref:DUF4153 domain-containing protein n=1 Tax=Sphingomonas rhamnosi TaxID=3096156 RepID=UPI002FC5D46A
MDARANPTDRMISKIGAVLTLVAIAEFVVDGNDLGAVVGGFAVLWLALMLATRRAVLRDATARVAAIVASLFAVVLVDDPSLLAWLLFCISLALASLLPRRGFDDALAWGLRVAWLGFTAILSPVRDAARIAIVRERQGRTAGGVRAVIRMLVIPIGGGAIFLALFASANPLIDRALATIVLPDTVTIVWRSLLAALVVVAVWTTLRPSAAATRLARDADRPTIAARDPGMATLTLSLVTFNAIFAIENALDIVFLWSGARLPADVTMADYAHRGAYSLIVTALLAALFVLVAFRPGNAGATRPIVRRLVAVWIGQNLLLVASSGLRTLDYVDAYGMTVLRLAALAWMALVATGLALIGWRLLTGRSTAWLINANALAAATVLTLASVIDLGATAAAWNARTALTAGTSGPPLDLCYMARLGSSALVPLATLERHTPQPLVRDRIAWLRWEAQRDTMQSQATWRSWTPRAARRLDTAETLVGVRPPVVRAAPNGRDCDGSVKPPPPAIRVTPTPLPTPRPTPLTAGAER